MRFRIRAGQIVLQNSRLRVSWERLSPYQLPSSRVIHVESAGFGSPLFSTGNITLVMIFRGDKAINVLNKPIWGTPNLNIDSTSFR